MKVFSETTRKNIAAITFGPLAIIPAALILNLITYLMFSESNQSTGWLLFFSLSVIGLVISYLTTICIGLPIILVLQKFNAFNWMTIVAAALIIVGIFCIYTSAQFIIFLYLGFFGSAVAIACWGIHQWK